MSKDSRTKDRATTGGVYVILITGLLTITNLGLEWNGLWQVAFVLFAGVVTVVCAWLLHRFIRHHRGEIGEARFDTRNKVSSSEKRDEQ